MSIYDLASRLGLLIKSDPFLFLLVIMPPLIVGLRLNSFVVRRMSPLLSLTYKLRAHNDREDHLIPRVIDPYSIRQLAALHHVWLSCGQPESLRVLDFGGALGSHFYSLSKYWNWSSLNWIVCETPLVAAAGKADFELDKSSYHSLSFTSDVQQPLSEGIDLVFASCSLQYVNNWLQILQFFRVSPWLLVDRLPLIDHPSDIIDIQVVPANYTDTCYPGWKFSSRSWLQRLSDLGFSPVLQWLVPEDFWSVLDLNTGQYRWTAKHDHGFLFSQSPPKSRFNNLQTFNIKTYNAYSFCYYLFTIRDLNQQFCYFTSLI